MALPREGPAERGSARAGPFCKRGASTSVGCRRELHRSSELQERSVGHSDQASRRPVEVECDEDQERHEDRGEEDSVKRLDRSSRGRRRATRARRLPRRPRALSTGVGTRLRRAATRVVCMSNYARSGSRRRAGVRSRSRCFVERVVRPVATVPRCISCPRTATVASAASLPGRSADSVDTGVGVVSSADRATTVRMGSARVCARRYVVPIALASSTIAARLVSYRPIASAQPERQDERHHAEEGGVQDGDLLA